jgi:hypothetical protein
LLMFCCSFKLCQPMICMLHMPSLLNMTIEVVDGCCRLPATYTIQSSAASVSISQNCSVANRRLSLLHLCQPCHALQQGSKSPGLGIFKAKHSQARPSTKALISKQSLCTL